MKTKIFTTILLIGLSLGIVFSQSINKPKLDSLFNVLAEKNKAMGSLTISKNGTVLYNKATGQSSFPLEATEKDKFKFDPAGVKMEFNTDKNEMTLKQGGGDYLFTKEK